MLGLWPVGRSGSVWRFGPGHASAICDTLCRTLPQWRPFTGLKAANCDLATLRNVFDLLQNHYPERWG